LHPAVEEGHPVELGEAIGQGLGGGRVVQLAEGIVVLDEAEAALLQLAC
jgi:hypothetical protein